MTEGEDTQPDKNDKPGELRARPFTCLSLSAQKTLDRPAVIATAGLERKELRTQPIRATGF